ncbi:MAG: MMPL family transporter [Deltaproteobacteria bacterium]|nr:MMPL family transporter [Deltaproteobacteria bacterium]
MASQRLHRLLARPRLVLALVALSTIPSTYLSVQLFRDVRADIKNLLPDSAESVVTAKEFERRFGGWSQLSIIVTSPSSAANRRFSDDLAARIRQRPGIRSVRNKLDAERAFFAARRHLFVELEDLEDLRERIEEAIDRGKARASPLFVDLDDDDEKGAEEIDVSDIEAKYTHVLDLAKRFPDGYFESEDKTELAIIVVQQGLSFGLDRNRALVAAVEAAIADLNPARYDARMEVGLGGDVKNLIEEQASLVEDLALASFVVLILLGLVVVVYFRRWRALVLISVPVYVGCSWCFAISYLLIGHLNASSAFLGPIVPGNGINYGLILLARYIEQRRAHDTVETALERAVGTTLHATSAAALAASVAYGSLMATDFLGFKHFGIIGGIGMVSCWAATFLVMPPLIAWFEAVRPTNPTDECLSLYRSGQLASILPRLIARAPRLVATVGAVGSLIAAVMCAEYLKDPLEKDFSKLRSTYAEGEGAAYWEAKIDRIFGRYLAPQIIVTDDAAQVPEVVAYLKEAIAREGDNAPIVDVQALDTLVPPDQEAKVEVLNEIRSLFSDEHLAALSPKAAELAREYRPPANLKPFTQNDLPESVRKDFRELDGQEGRVVLVLPNLKLNLYHAAEIARVAELLQHIPLSDGSIVKSSGSFVVFNDMLRAVETDGPKATLYSLLGIILLTIVAYRRPLDVLIVVGTLLIGVAGLGAAALLIDLRINFLNFIALPITFGVGVDYAVNTYARYLIERTSGQDRPTAAKRALSTTGGAVFLCSLTTIIGYSSLLIARNGALVSFGKLAVLGEMTCVVAALIIMPSFLMVTRRRVPVRAQAPGPLGP